jgi:hypothetical protein
MSRHLPKHWPEQIQLLLAIVLQIAIAILVTGAMIRAQWLVAFTGSVVLTLSFLPALIERELSVHLPVEFTLVVNFFLYASFGLGEVQDYYQRYWWWDIFLHSFSAVVMGLIGFLIIFVFYMTKRISIAPIYVAVSTFCFAVTLGVLWEIFEFSMDWFGGFNMQKSGRVDTMTDLIVDSTGAMVAATVGYGYVKNGSSSIADRIVRRFVAKNPRLFR